MFSGPLRIEEIGYERFSVLDPFRFTSSTGVVCHVPSGFETDLASVPQIFRSIVGKIGYWTQPAVAHDWMYYRHRMGFDTAVTRKEADMVLLEGCLLKAKEYDVPERRQRNALIYQAVRAGGLATWETPAERNKRADRGDDEFLDQ